MYYDLVKVRYVSGYILNVEFADGTSGDVDFTNVIAGVRPFKAFADINIFSRAYVGDETRTLCWSSELDYVPMILYYKANHIPFPSEWGDVA